MSGPTAFRWIELRMGGGVYPYGFLADPTHGNQSHPLYKPHLDEVRNWCRDQFGGAHYGKSGGWHRKHDCFYFSDPVQAFAFKVRWL